MEDVRSRGEGGDDEYLYERLGQYSYDMARIEYSNVVTAFLYLLERVGAEIGKRRKEKKEV